MTSKDKVQFLVFRTFGNFLLLIALYGVYLTFSPVISQEFRVRVEGLRGIRYRVIGEEQLADFEIPSIPQNPPGALQALISDKKEYTLVPKDPLFSILIPRIGASEKVIINIDPANPNEYRNALQKGVAHAKGSVFPGLSGNTYLFAHSADSWLQAANINATFYLLKDLEIGDEVVVFFENRRYNYYVTGKYIADPSEVSLLVNSQTTDEQLILQTCWPPGTTWKRLFIVARPKRT